MIAIDLIANIVPPLMAAGLSWWFTRWYRSLPSRHVMFFLACAIIPCGVDIAAGQAWIAAVWIPYLAIWADYLWRNRKNKRKHIEKVLGMVKNIGHRLVVVSQ